MKWDDENYYINLDDKVLIENQRCVIPKPILNCELRKY
jgi:hypothetical protein